ncbi:hypothetical protein LZC95_00145 [Pendulispora brunnea]|uniref:Uncharacterized protein n=1 Tax=Pendulispora brunnea TaxID=2905690 RepID=A0ABZ2K9D4_9BACT
MAIEAKSGAALAAALGVILVLALPGCGSSDDGNAPAGGAPQEQNNNNDVQLPEVPAGKWGVNAMVNDSQIQYGDAAARRKGTESWVNASQSSDPNVGDLRLKIPGSSAVQVPVLAPGDYGCEGISMTFDGDGSYSVDNAKKKDPSASCTLKIEASDTSSVKGTIKNVTLVNDKGASVKISARFSAQVRKPLKPAPPPAPQ